MERAESIITETGHLTGSIVLVVIHVLLSIFILRILSTTFIFEALVVFKVLVVDQAIIIIAAQILRIRILWREALLVEWTVRKIRIWALTVAVRSMLFETYLEHKDNYVEDG